MSLGVIVRLDGTFVDSNDARAQAWLEALREQGYGELPFKEVRRLVGLPPNDFLLKTSGFGEDTPVGKAIRDRHHHILQYRYLRNLTPFLRGAELMHCIRASGIRVVPISTDPEPLLAALLRLVSAEPLTQQAVHAGNIPPAASCRELMRIAVERASVPSGRCVVLTDSPHDVQAAKALGLPSIGFESGGFSGAELGANLSYESAARLYEEYDSSPLAPQMVR